MYKPGSDEYFMRLALKEAQKGIGLTSPNPPVGAVIVKEGKVLGRGFHKGAGLPHAEVEALKDCKASPAGATMYVTLEPCNHWGRTPPCTDAIISAKIRTVVIGVPDPNPNVKGGGKERLLREGIEVREGVLKEECEESLEAYLKQVKTGLPFVYAKAALTLDGFTATSTGESKWITGEEARRHAHKLRHMVDAIVVGVQTVIKDNPRLTQRLGGRYKKQPLRVVLDTHLRTPLSSEVIRDGGKTLLLVGESVEEEKIAQFNEMGVPVRRCPLKEGVLDLGSVLSNLGENRIQSILLEGGSRLMGSFVSQRLVDKFFVFLAPKLLAGEDGYPMIRGKGPRSIRDCIQLDRVKVIRLGKDVLISGYPLY